jgi:hypothetical protein
VTVGDPSPERARFARLFQSSGRAAVAAVGTYDRRVQDLDRPDDLRPAVRFARAVVVRARRSEAAALIDEAQEA